MEPEWTAKELKECRVWVVSGTGKNKRISFQTSAEYELTALLMLQAQMAVAVLDWPTEGRIEGICLAANGRCIGEFSLKDGAA